MSKPLTEDLTRQRVYFIQNADTGSVKIGTARDPDARLRALKTGSDARLSIIRIVTGGRKTERWLHRRFVAYGLRGEWFAFHPDMLTVVPPDEVPPQIVEVIRRDVRLTVRERAREYQRFVNDGGMTPRQALAALSAKLTEDEAAEVMKQLLGHA